MDLRELPAVLVARHPWERARAKFFAHLLATAGHLPAPCHVLDVGAGDGYVAGRLFDLLPAESSVACVDDRYTDALIARLSNDAPHGLSSGRARPDRRFDLVLLLDVLEHVRDDASFLREIVESALAPGGAALVSVPAFGWLFTRRDCLLGHYRRYSPSSLRAVLDASGLAVRRSGGLFHSLLLPRAVLSLVERARPPRDESDNSDQKRFGNTELGRWRAGVVVTALVRALLACDNACSRVASRTGLNLPGMSAWALCTRKDGARREVTAR